MAWYNYLNPIYDLQRLSGVNDAGVTPMLQAAAAGKVPSAAEEQMRQGMGRAVANQYALARSSPGVAPGSALRQASLGAAMAGQGIAGQAAALRAQEQAQARQQLAAYTSQDNQNKFQLTGSVLGGAAALGQTMLSGKKPADDQTLVSDERKKRKIRPGDVDAEALLDALHAYDFEYEHGAGAPGQHLGVMAQDVERAPAGAALVRDTKGGKTIDPAQAIGAILASLGNLHGRLKAMEGGSR